MAGKDPKDRRVKQVFQVEMDLTELMEIVAILAGPDKRENGALMV